MRTWISRLKLVTLIVLAALLAQCGGKKSRSAEASTWAVLPNEPIVILGPTKDSTGADVQGPWFAFRLQMSNSDTETITIMAIDLTITGTDPAGGITTKSITFTPTMFDHSYTDNDVEKQCKYYSFGEIPAGGANIDLSLPTADVNCTLQPYFVVGDLGRKDVGSSYRYRVKARPLGWFGPFANPKDRYDMSFDFNTK
ncbi:MAG: hypothetical protein KF799_07480 [Bdellovibrionales bacterium]|nr:hypothetical protein [Bdellovibrionales bacterium]